jgi:hypothetical protein
LEVAVRVVFSEHAAVALRLRAAESGAVDDFVELGGKGSSVVFWVDSGRNALQSFLRAPLTIFG